MAQMMEPSTTQNQRRHGPTEDHISTVCFRVTRACNLSCPYCQAPPNQKQLTLSELRRALCYFSQIGTERIKFTGGEPFIYHGMLQLIGECRTAGMEPTVITNGTTLPPGAIDCLRSYGARMKISLHGPREIHNAMQNKNAYDDVIATVRKLIAADIETSIHTMLHRGFNLNLRRWIEFLASEGVHKVSFMTFIPRGRGSSMKEQWSFSIQELERLSEDVSALATVYKQVIVVRHLDFARKRYLVFETSGSIVWELGDESNDSFVIQVPSGSFGTFAPGIAGVDP